MHINLSNIMGSYLITIFLAFLEGLALILSPCILPILPIILASSLTYSKKRPLGIITGFALTFAVFSYFAHNLVLLCKCSIWQLNRTKRAIAEQHPWLIPF